MSELVEKASQLVRKLRDAEALITSGKLDEGIALFNEAVKEARELNLYRPYIAIIRKIQRLIEVEKKRALKRGGQAGGHA